MAVTRIKNNQITDATIVASAKLTDYTVTSAKLANNIVYGSDFTISGNLTVNGQTTTIDSTTTTIEDPVILLASTQTGSPSVDIGYIGERGTSQNIAFVWDESATEFVTAFTNDAITNTTITIASYANFHTNNANVGGNLVVGGNISITGNIASLNVTGNITGGNLLTPGLFSATGNVNGGNIISAALVQGVTVSASGNVIGGNVTTGGLISATSTITSGANISGANILTGGLVSATGTITGGNLATGGTASVTGNITGGNVLTGGLISATGNVNGGNVISSALVQGATVSASGNVIGGNVTTGGLISASGNVTGGNVLTGGLVSATGNVTGGNVVSSALVQGVTVSASGNVIGGNVTTGGLVSASGNITGGNVLTGGLISATGNITSAANVAGGNLLTGGLVSATGNITGGNLITSGSGGSISGTGNITGGNILTSGQVSAVGNITANIGSFFIGNGSQLTGVSASTSGFPVSAGNSNISATANGNIFVTVGGTANVIVWATTGQYVTGLISANGTVTGGNLATGGTASATGNITGGNLLTGGQIVSTQAGNGTAGAGQIYLNGTGNNRIDWAATGTGAPTFTTRSSGVKTLLYPSISGSITDYAIGIDAATMWYGVPENGASFYFKWYGATTEVASISGTGVVSAVGTITGGNLATGGTASAGGNVTGANILTGGLVSATSTITSGANITGANILTGGQVSATGNVTGGNVNTTQVYSTGALTLTNTTGNINLTTAGNVVLNNTYLTGLQLTPVGNTDAASKHYVDQIATTGLAYHAAVIAATTTTLATATGGTITYTQPNGAGNGVGALLTTTGAFNLIDTANVQTLGTRILVKDEANAVFNGVYTWANATNIVRSTDTDQYGANSAEELSINDYFFVTSGNVNAGSAWIVDSPSGVITFGTSNIAFAQFSSSQTYTGGNGISIAGTVISAKVDNNTTAFDGSGNIIVKASANLTTPNIGAATGTSLSVSGNVAGGNVLTGGLVSATGTITGGNLATGGTTSATGTITGGNLATGGTVSATSTITGGNIATGGTVSATSTITGGNIATGGTISSNGNITGANILTGGLVSATSTITSGANISGGNLLTGGLVSATGTITGGNLATGGTVSATSTITGGNLATGGTVSATSTITGGNLATGGTVSAGGNITGANILTGGLVSATSTITSGANISGGNLLTGGLISATATITGGNLATGGTASATGNITGGNILTGGQVSAVGNITANIGSFFIGNGSQLTGISASTSGFPITAGNSNISATTNGNIFVTVGGTANVAVFATSGQYVTGEISANGNVTGGNILTGGLISATGNITSAANVTGGNILTGGIVSATGNIIGGNAIIGNAGGYGDVTTTQFAGIFAKANGLNATSLMQVKGNDGINGMGMRAVTGSNALIYSNAAIELRVGSTINDLNTPSAGTTIATIASTGLAVTGIVSASGNVTGGNVLTGGLITATGNITGGNLITAGLATVTGNVTGGNVLTGGLISATGNINGGNLISAANLTITGGNIFSTAADITVNGASGDVNFAVNGDTTTVFFVDAGTETASFGNSTQTTNAIVAFNASNSIKFPVGNTAQRPATGVTGMIRFNTTLNAVEIYDNSAWSTVGTPTFTVIADEQFNGDGVTVNFTLGSSQTTNSCIVSINGVVQVPTVAYSVAGTFPTCVLTFTEAPLSGDLIDVREITTTTTITSISNSPGNAVVGVNATVGNVEITGNIMPTANATANIGSASFQYNTIFAQATSALYADLAEKYTADAEYAPGTVVAFGGSNEVTISSVDGDRRVAGVISTNPSYRMNDGLISEHTAMVALTGRVPTLVTGTVCKGDMMVSAGNGAARAEANPAIGTVIGKALADSEGDAVIEVVVGRV